MKYITMLFIFGCMSCVNPQHEKQNETENTDVEEQSAQNKFPVKSIHSSTKKSVDIMVTSLDGSKTTSLSQLLANDKNYVVSLMASWCGPCIAELNAFQKVSDKWSSEMNTEIIALSIEKPSDTHKLLAKVKKQGWTMKVVHDKMAYTSRELGVFDIPHTFLINKNREITFSTEGYTANIVSTYEAEIKKLQI